MKPLEGESKQDDSGEEGIKSQKNQRRCGDTTFNTIGPVQRLKSLSQRAHLAYVAKLLPKLEELGWIHASAVGWYQQNLTPGTPGLYKQVEQDLNAGKITTEFFSLIQATKR